jgi:CheY-like chemotaxis protein
MMAAQRILWVDDEIEHLKSHVLFLKSKGYEVEVATNGEDAIQMVRNEQFDILLLDESMPGMGGLETLNEIKEIDPMPPVIMITKNEAEQLMDEAIGMKIDDYLLKPVNPLQIYSACKRILDTKKIQENRLSRDYIREFSDIDDLIRDNTWDGWLRIHKRLCSWDLEFDRFPDSGLELTHDDQRQVCNQHFGRFIEAEYRNLIRAEGGPLFSPDVVRNFVAPYLSQNRNVYFIVIDCVRLDQWLVIEEILEEYYSIKKDYYLSILPTATPYARNAIFSGLYPDEIAARYPDRWQEKSRDEISKNRFESFFLEEQLKSLGFGDKKMQYFKVYSAEKSGDLKKRIGNYLVTPFTAFVFNFIDILTHGRNQSEILREIASDEAALRSLMRSWFSHSVLLEILKEISRQQATVIMTTDHGSVQGRKASLVQGRRDTSTNLRYKFGDNLKCNESQSIMTKRPEEYRLPAESKTKTYVFARENYYFVYPTNFRDYEKQYQGSFQHGGVSLDEMILPCLTLTPRV